MQINFFVDHPKYLAISTYESSEPIPGSWFTFWMILSWLSKHHDNVYEFAYKV